MFGFFTRKNTDGTNASPVIQNLKLHTPPPGTPSPPVAVVELPAQDQTMDMVDSDLKMDLTTEPTATEDALNASPILDNLHSLIASVPAKTLHAYTLSRLPNTQELHVPALRAFFAELEPPPSRHCVRCHRNFFDVENDNRACVVAHDDESAEVERTGLGAGATFETRWGCCGRTVEGDGDQGPPDGWCYEGPHTIDLKRARFRADSTPQDDKLASCKRKRCAHILAPPVPAPVPPSPAPTSSTTSNSRKRLRSVAPLPPPGAAAGAPTTPGQGPAKRARGKPRKSVVPMEEDGPTAPIIEEPASVASPEQVTTEPPPVPQVSAAEASTRYATRSRSPKTSAPTNASEASVLAVLTDAETPAKRPRGRLNKNTEGDASIVEKRPRSRSRASVVPRSRVRKIVQEGGAESASEKDDSAQGELGKTLKTPAKGRGKKRVAEKVVD